MIDHPNIDPKSGLHTHILSLKGSENSECVSMGAPLEVDIANSVANEEGFFADLDWKKVWKTATVRNIPIGDAFLAEAGIETVVAFEAHVIPPTATNPLGLDPNLPVDNLEAICIVPKDLKGVNPLG